MSIVDATDSVRTARICYEATRVIYETAGDYSNPPWTQLSTLDREKAVRFVLYECESPHETPEQQHDAWCAHMTESRWVYGSVRNKDLKTDPNLVPYATLPLHRRIADAVFKSLVAAHMLDHVSS